MNTSRRLPHSALIVPSLGLLFAVMFAAQNYYRSVVMHQGPSLGNIAMESFARWLLYAALAPAVGALAYRAPLQRGRLRTRIPLHAAAALLFAVVHCVSIGIIYRIFHVYPRQDSIGEAIARLLMVYFGLDCVVFWTIDAIYHALRYHEESRSRELVEAELRTSLTEARLQALRAQLNPHFLFNTLNATSVLALTGEREQVVQTLSALGDLLRVALDRDLPQEIPLARELEILDRYLEIQRTRFGDRLTVEIDVPPALRAALVPSMLLQPLVENAIQHAIAVRPGPGRLRIHAEREGAALRLRVEDTGPGFAGTAPVAPGVNGGIGLTNTTARLEQLYGSDQRLTCGNLDDHGAFVEISIPYRGAAA